MLSSNKKDNAMPNGIPLNNEEKINHNSNKFGALLYEVPNNRTVTKYSEGDILMPGDLPKNEFIEM